MSVEAFVDTNVILYAASRAPGDRVKSETALGVLRDCNFGVSLQVLQEFYHNARTKARLKISEEDCDRILDLLLGRPLVVTDVRLFHEARRVAGRFGLGYWDAAIVAAAQRLRAPLLYSEDLGDGQKYDGVLVVNPFKRT